MTSFVKKSAPIVARYELVNCFLTYWFRREVLPTLYFILFKLNYPASPNTITLSKHLLLEDIEWD
jgi:hypothetical protein